MENINMEKFLADFAELYGTLDKKDDHLYEKHEKAEQAGDTKRAAKIDRRMDINLARMQGMVDVLEMLGYTVIWQELKPVIVRR